MRSYPTRASYSGQVDGFRNPMKNKLKTRSCSKRFQTRMQIFFICVLIKQENTVHDDKQLYNTFCNINFQPKLFTAPVKCNGTVI